MSNKEEKDCQITKEEKGRKKGKKHKDKGRGGDCDSSIHSGDRNHSIEMEQADVSATMAENPCLEHAEGAMSKSSVKKIGRKRRKIKRLKLMAGLRYLMLMKMLGQKMRRGTTEKENMIGSRRSANESIRMMRLPRVVLLVIKLF